MHKVYFQDNEQEIRTCDSKADTYDVLQKNFLLAQYITSVSSQIAER